MKKFFLIALSLGSLLVSTAVYAVSPAPISSPTSLPLNIITPVEQVQIKRPGQGIDPATNVGTIVSNAISLVFVAAILLVLFFLVIGAFEWITSGGEKEAVGKARGRIINALIGLAILALAFLLARLAGQIVNVDIFDLKIPQLGPR